LTNYVLDQFSGELERLGLYEAIRATYCRMEVSVPNFYAILELYYPSTRTFFTLVGELGVALIKAPNGLSSLCRVLPLPLGAITTELPEFGYV